MEYLYVVFAVLAVLRTAESLRCWNCQSTDESSCSDYFNETTIRRSATLFSNIDRQIPSEKNCDYSLSAHDPTQKAVCTKKVETINGRKHYTRKCDIVHVNQPIGECPKEITDDRRVYVDFCQQCDRDFCNTGNIPRAAMFWLMLVPIVSILFLRK